MSSFIKDVFRVGLSKVLMIFFGLITSIITARYIGPEGNGIIAGLAVYPSLFMTIGSLGIRQSTTFFLGKKLFSEEQIKTAITQIWMFTTITSLIVCFILMYFFSTSGSNLILVFLALAPIPFSLFNTYNSGIFLGKNDIKTFNKINWIPTFVILIFTIVFVVFLNLDVKGAMIGLIGGPLIMFVLLLFKNNFIKSFSFKYEWKLIKKMLALGLIYAITLLIINLNYKIDVILLDKLGSAYELGIYSKGSSLSQYLWNIPMLLSTIVFARSAASKNNSAFSLSVVKLLRISMVLISLGCLFLFVFSDFIIVTLYGIDFSESITVLNILLPGVLLLTILKVLYVDLAGRGKPWVALYAMVPSLVINIILNVILIPEYGAKGSAISSTISYSVGAIIFLIYYSREVNIPIKKIFSYQKDDYKELFLKIKNR